ncbi:holo-ACP synthase [Sedimentibacter sp. MB31-C6]|uniref:holo-ACP synthase n=1 Tax=Sedimentibacter sp. MB31-C6 TaxID=3109366 RepID=UPI002DDD058B|nr:holo-ACP synthase [Sedimentibacter sp. MB36-C1]WSI03898.1 holo-ACP synthase [Sedimentibacter sp. MB36-C1]
MIIGNGVDITEVDRIKKNLDNKRFLFKIYSESEITYLKNRKFNSQTAAGMFAAKEAVSKCLGTGFTNFGPKDIEILKDDKGKPYVNLRNNARERATQLELTNIQLSISHTKDYAIAFCIVEK